MDKNCFDQKKTGTCRAMIAYGLKGNSIWGER